LRSRTPINVSGGPGIGGGRHYDDKGKVGDVNNKSTELTAQTPHS